MSQILIPGLGAVENIYLGTDRVERVYLGDDLAWSRDTAGRPTISSLTVSAPSSGVVTVRWAVSGSRNNSLTLDGAHVPNTTGTTAVIAAPGPGRHRYVLTSSNAAGAVSRTLDVDTNAAPTISGFTVGYTVSPGSNVVTAFFTWRWTGYPKPAFTIDFGEGSGFESVAASHVPGASGGSSTRLSHVYPSNQRFTARLHAGSPQGTADATVAVQT